jgi:methanethiol S-methyltransferase
MLGFLIGFWATPFMTVGHLVFALVTTGYILIALRLEERDLVARFGEQYAEYRRRVRGLLPLPRATSAPAVPERRPTRVGTPAP